MISGFELLSSFAFNFACIGSFGLQPIAICVAVADKLQQFTKRERAGIAFGIAMK